MNKKRTIVAHPGKQHSFRLASSLIAHKNLYCYITTVYYNPNKLIYKILTYFLRYTDESKRMKGRESNLISPFLIQFYELRSLFVLFLQRIDKKGIILNNFDIVHNSFSKKVANYAIKNKKNINAVVMYDTNGLPCFKMLEKHDIVRIMDVSIAARNYTVNIFTKEAEKEGVIAKEFNNYIVNYKKNTKAYQKLIDEIQYVDHFIVPSTFVKESLIFNNITEDKISIVPYGVDIKKFTSKEYRKKNVDDTLNLLFVGTLTQRKGIGYLLEAIKQMNDKRIRLKVVGKPNGTDEIFKNYLEYFEHIESVTADKISSVYKEADVYIFPTLSEGFSLTILEAMASGLPIITTVNSGAEGIVSNGLNGIMINTGNISDIIFSIQYFLDNPESIEKMGSKSRLIALNNTWENYENNIKQVFEKLGL